MTRSSTDINRNARSAPLEHAGRPCVGRSRAPGRSTSQRPEPLSIPAVGRGPRRRTAGRHDDGRPELISRHDWATRAATSLAIAEYIECFYNTRRRHSFLGLKSPAAYEKGRLTPVVPSQRDQGVHYSLGNPHLTEIPPQQCATTASPLLAGFPASRRRWHWDSVAVVCRLPRILHVECADPARLCRPRSCAEF